jgi:hypothetical protein
MSPDQRPWVVLVDVDGTIADMGRDQPDRRGPFDWTRVHEDTPIEPVLRLVRLLAASGVPIIFITGRMEQCRLKTARWLSRHAGVGVHAQLFMRGDDDYRPDEELKEDLFCTHIDPAWRVWFVLDDRDKVVAMWRSLGLTCLQTAPGAF